MDNTRPQTADEALQRSGRGILTTREILNLPEYDAFNAICQRYHLNPRLVWFDHPDSVPRFLHGLHRVLTEEPCSGNTIPWSDYYRWRQWNMAWFKLMRFIIWEIDANLDGRDSGGWGFEADF